MADELSFSRAAAHLKITQPALTKQIQVLESILGVVLFERSNQRVEITEPGKIFVENARTSLLSLDRAVFLTRVAFKGAESVLNFGSSPYADPYLIANILSLRLPLSPDPPGSCLQQLVTSIEYAGYVGRARSGPRCSRSS